MVKHIIVAYSIRVRIPLMALFNLNPMKKKRVIKDIYYRKIFSIFEFSKVYYSIYSYNKVNFKWKTWVKKYNLNQVYSSRIKNLCSLTGRGKSILRIFKLSRLQVKKQALNKNLVGVIKSSW